VNPPPPPAAATATDASLPTHSELARLRRGRMRAMLTMLGPAFVASIAYVDPGNFATNIQGGARFGYLLLWVVLAANLMAMLIQYLSAKLGVATGRSLPEMCRETLGKRTSWGLWVQAELIAMATDLAEFVGAAIALNLLGMPLFVAGLVTAVAAFGILALQNSGHRKFESAIIVLLGSSSPASFTTRCGSASTSATRPRASCRTSTAPSRSSSRPASSGRRSCPTSSTALALMQKRVGTNGDGEKRELMRFVKVDVIVAMALAGLVNMAMLITAASLFHGVPGINIDDIEAAHAGFIKYAGAGAGLAFALALLASGFASSSVGTYAGQVVMQGFIRRSIPLMARRAVTMAPALIVLAFGTNPAKALVLSQVVLSFGIPFALVPLVILTRRKDLMGGLVNRRRTTIAASVVAALIICLNVVLLVQTLG
jgi:manganese transport protein